VWYTQSTPHKIERHIASSKIVYTYGDRRGGFLYIANQFDYHERLLRETMAAETQVQAIIALDNPWCDWRWTWQP
jgi:alpha-D-ribose 1-methylphosphonate 5-triphosphate synthase subunit PhnI